MMLRSGSSSSTLKVLLAGRRLNKMNDSHQFARSFSAATHTADQSSLRRRRRRGGNKSDQDDTASSSSPLIPHDPSIETIASDTAFSPKDSQGNLLDAQEYLSLASMSPWVPCPDMVIKRVFEIAETTNKDVHVDLGCGDGRLNFAAVDGPNYVQSSWGVDVDRNILDKCRERLGRRYVPRGGDFGMSSKKSESDEMSSKLEFLQADLKLVIERQKEIHQQQQLEQQQSSSAGNESSTNNVTQNDNKDWSKEDDITSRLSQSTLVTMYFVHDALQQLQPYLASTLGGKEYARVITVGYEMKGWEASWVERVLGLTIFKYDMEKVSSDPLEWRVIGGNGNDEDDNLAIAVAGNNEDAILKAEINNFDGDYYDNVDIDDDDDDESSELAKYLKQKREQDMEELNAGLEIHHDEALNDFAQFRSKGGSNNSTTANHDHDALSSQNNNNAPSIVHDDDDDDDDDDDWDFDETEDPEEVMRKAQKEMAEAKMGGRGKGMMTGVDTGKKDKLDGRGGGQGGGGENNNKAKSDAMDTRTKPVWRKPE